MIPTTTPLDQLKRLEAALAFCHKEIDLLHRAVFNTEDEDVIECEESEYLYNSRFDLALHTECNAAFAYEWFPDRKMWSEPEPVCESCYNDNCSRCGAPMDNPYNRTRDPDDISTLCGRCWADLMGRD